MSDLQRMAEIFGEGDPTVRLAANGNYVLESSTFNALHDAAVVKMEAERRLKLMNGALRAADPNARSVQLRGQFWDSNKPHTVVIPATAEGRVTMTSVAVGTVNGVPVDPPAPPARAWVALAESDPNVADVLRLRATGDLDWATLYKILEIICGEVSGDGILTEAGKKVLIKRDWATREQLRALTASANKETVSGDAARHARTKGGVPAKVMTLDEGRYFLKGLVYTWLMDKRK